VPRLLPGRHALPVLVAVIASMLLAVLTAKPSSAVVVTGAGSVEVTVANQDAEELPRGDVAFPVGSEGMAKAQEVAVAFWGRQPCGGTYDLAWTPMDSQTNGTASWKNPTDAWNNVGENFDCEVDLNPEAGFDFPKLCTVLAHEIGHLIGNQHAEQPNLLMSTYYSEPLPECVAADPTPKPVVEEEPLVVEADVAVAKRASVAKPRAKRASSATSRARKIRLARHLAAKRKVAFKRCVRRFRATGRSKSVWRCHGLARRKLTRRR
jgi:hypothetical protein